MKAALVPRSRSLRFAITPMIDIVFLLIIFFLVSTHFVQSETQAPVELPLATQASSEEEVVPQRLVITVSADGTYTVSGRVLIWPDIEAMILQSGKNDEPAAEREIRIRGDRATQYEFIKPILIACAQVGITRISFSVLPDQS